VDLACAIYFIAACARIYWARGIFEGYFWKNRVGWRFKPANDGSATASAVAAVSTRILHLSKNTYRFGTVAEGRSWGSSFGRQCFPSKPGFIGLRTIVFSGAIALNEFPNYLDRP
jgi:hypothetical protein